MRKNICIVILIFLLCEIIFAQESNVIKIENSIYKFKIGSEPGAIGLTKNEQRVFTRELSMPGFEKSEGPSAFTFDMEGNLYILDCISNRISKYNKDFQFNVFYPITINSYVSKIQVYNNGFLLFDHDGDFDYLTFFDKNGNCIWTYLNMEDMDINTVVYLEKSKIIINYDDEDMLFCIYDLNKEQKRTKSESIINNLLKNEDKIYVKENFLYTNEKKFKKDIKFLQNDFVVNNVSFLGFDLGLNNYFDNVRSQILIGNINNQEIAYPEYNILLKDSEKRADYPAVHPSGDIYFLIYSVENSTVELRVLENTWSPETKKKWEEYCKNNESTNVHVNEVKTCNDNLRLRQEEATSSAIITTMQKGTKVKILKLGKAETIDGISSNWVQVEVQSGAKDIDGKETDAGAVGWCYGGYLE